MAPPLTLLKKGQTQGILTFSWTLPSIHQLVLLAINSKQILNLGFSHYLLCYPSIQSLLSLTWVIAIASQLSPLPLSHLLQWITTGNPPKSVDLKHLSQIMLLLCSEPTITSHCPWHESWNLYHQSTSSHHWLPSSTSLWPCWPHSQHASLFLP